MCERLLQGLILGILVLTSCNAFGGTMRDPLRPPVVVSGSTSAKEPSRGWNLASTLVAGDQRSAVINGRVLKIGDRVDGAEVVDIQPGAVRLRHSESEFHVKLSRPGIKQEARP